MSLRPALVVLSLLAAGCGYRAGGEPPPHHPDLSIGKVAETAEFRSDIFDSYNAGGPVRWNQGWPWKFDLSGIGWDNPRTVTAITSRHVVMANHYKRKVGMPAVFHDRKGRPHPRTIVRVMSTAEAGLTSDIAVGLLDRPLPPSVRTYPLLEFGEDDAGRLAGARALVTDQHRRLFTHQIRSVSGGYLGFQFDPRLHDSRRKRLVSGDSGNPSFLLTHGELALIETHTSGGPGSGPFYGSGKTVDVIRKIVARLDPAYRIRTVGIDAKVAADAASGRSHLPGSAPSRPAAAPRGADSPPPPTRKPRPRVVVPPPGGE